jgi:hypothetical protein
MLLTIQDLTNMAQNYNSMEKSTLKFSKQQLAVESKHGIYSGLRIFSFVLSYPSFNDVLIAHIIQGAENPT